MPSDGSKLLSIWRESYGWWNDEPYRETRRIIDINGKVVTKEKDSKPLGELGVKKQTKSLVNEDNPTSAVNSETKEAYELRRDKMRRDKSNVRLEQFKNINLNLISQVNSIAHLHCLSGYSFGKSTLLAEEIANYGAMAGCKSLAITDCFSLSGVLEFNKSCRKLGIKPILGASIELDCYSGDVVLLAQNQIGYQNLSRLISACHLDEPRQSPLATLEKLHCFNEGLICLTGGDSGPLDPLIASENYSAANDLIQNFLNCFGKDRLFLEVERGYLPWSCYVEKHLHQLAEKFHLTCFAGGKITHARRANFPAQDILACANILATVEDPVGRKPFRDPDQLQIASHPRRSLNAERFLKTKQELSKLYQDRPDLIANTLHISELCENNVLPIRPNLPQLFENDAESLIQIVEARAHEVYPQITSKHKKRLQQELSRITQLGFSTHFLIAGDLCRWAGEQKIHFSGRGSVIDSAVAYVLGFSRIDAIQHNLHFDRFLPSDGSKRPDIDIDFEAHRRDDIRGYAIRRFGVERTACVSAFGTYRTRGIVRQVGKAMELPDTVISYLAKRIHGGVSPDHLEEAIYKRPELRDSPMDRAKFRWVFKLARDLADVPFGIGCHSSGLVISAQPIKDIVPVMWSATPSSSVAETSEPYLRLMQWDKRSAKHYFDKFDILCLRGQDVISGTEDRIRINQPEFNAQKIGIEDPEIYRAMRSGELIGIPQSASPAMRQAHIRLRTDNLHDASLVQAGIRPGVGGSVKINELILRRRGQPFTYEHPDFEKILGLTYGIIIFQEQVDQLLQHFCGYTSGEAEDIRDAIHKNRREDYGNTIRDQLLERCLTNGFNANVADKVCELVAGFKGYGFAQGHALAFAELSLRCVWLMQNEPAAYFSSLLSAQPAGYYGPCTIANEARSRGVQILPPSVIHSADKFTIETGYDALTNMRIPGAAIRTGLMQILELSTPVKERILSWNKVTTSQVLSRKLQPLPSTVNSTSNILVAEMQSDYDTISLSPFVSFFDFVAKVRPTRTDLESLIMCGALDELCSSRRAMLWAIPQAQDYMHAHEQSGSNPSLPLILPEPEIDYSIIDFDNEERVALERNILGMDIITHLMSFERERIGTKAITARSILNMKDGDKAAVVGNPIRLRFPPTASGKRVVFFDLEDETGLLNVTAFDATYQKYGKAMITSPYVTVLGKVQNRDGHIAFLAEHVYDYKPVLLSKRSKKVPIHGADFLCG